MRRGWPKRLAPLFYFSNNQKMKILESANYSEFKKKLAESNCRLCDLSQSRTHIVVDRGNPEAKILFIGEGPGEKEDLEAKAFVGRSGKLLDKLMLEAGFDTNKESLIINVVKCRPPKNRSPKKIEAETCLPYLKKQMELVRPEIVILLGKTALQYILPDKEIVSMKEEVGKFFVSASYPGAQFMIFFHPAYLLRDPRKLFLAREHIKTFKVYYDR